MISIIIPAKNEEKYLPKLLSSIERQRVFGGFEVIVADASSTDKTKEIANYYGCKVVDGGLPAFGRNIGARYSKGDTLVFIDSDVILPDESFLEKALREFNERELKIAGTLQKPLTVKNKVLDWLYSKGYKVVNKKMLKSEDKEHKLMQVCMFAKRDVFECIGGFDESILFGEDSHLAKKAGIEGYKFGILKTPKEVWLSTRRFENEGLIKTSVKSIYFNVIRGFGYEFRRGKSNLVYFKD